MKKFIIWVLVIGSLSYLGYQRFYGSENIIANTSDTVKVKTSVVVVDTTKVDTTKKK